MSTTLYRLYSTENTLLYIGVSDQVESRLLCQHLVSKRWWFEVERATFEHFESRGMAELCEREAIRIERPLYNIAHNELPNYVWRGQLDDLIQNVAEHLEVTE